MAASHCGGGLIVLFIVGTWVFFYLYPLVPLVGHFLWIAGVLLISGRGVAEADRRELSAELYRTGGNGRIEG